MSAQTRRTIRGILLHYRFFFLSLRQLWLGCQHKFLMPPTTSPFLFSAPCFFVFFRPGAILIVRDQLPTPYTWSVTISTREKCGINVITVKI